MEKAKPRRPKWGEPGSKTRRVVQAYVFSAGKRRQLVVTVYPDGNIGIRLSRHKREEYGMADDLYRQFVMTRKRNERDAKRRKK